MSVHVGASGYMYTTFTFDGERYYVDRSKDGDWDVIKRDQPSTVRGSLNQDEVIEEAKIIFSICKMTGLEKW